MPRGSAGMRRAWRSFAPVRTDTTGISISPRSGASGRAAASSAPGCSIPCAMRSSATPDLVNLLLDPAIARRHSAGAGRLETTVSRAADAGIPMLAHTTALGYFDSYRTARLPQSLTQAQRDAFGAHTYERIDRPGAVHSEW